MGLASGQAPWVRTIVLHRRVGGQHSLPHCAVLDVVGRQRETARGQVSHMSRAAGLSRRYLHICPLWHVLLELVKTFLG